MEQSDGDDFETVTLKLGTVASGIANCEHIVLRSGERSRLLFEATLVDKPDHPRSVRGRLVYQKKKAEENWSNCSPVDLRQVKAGQAVSIELKSADVASLRQWLCDLAALVNLYGAPQDTKFVGVRRNWLASIIGEPEVEIVAARDGTTDDVVDVLRALMVQKDLSALADAIGTSDISELMKMRERLGASALDRLIHEWEAMSSDTSEEEWQKLLTKYAFALGQVFYTPTVVVQEKAYLGGKAFDNKGGSVVDFLCRNVAAGRAQLIEIKKPSTPLLESAEYREGAFAASRELAGALAQTLNYRGRLHEKMTQRDDSELLKRALPGCALIIGDSKSLATDAQARSFEFFRNRADIIILTFDEVLARLKAIREALLSAPDAGAVAATST